MGQVIRKKMRGMSLTAKISMVLLATLFMTVFAYQGWMKPKISLADVNVLQAWSSVYAGNAFPTNYTYTVPSGPNRMLVVAVTATTTAAVTQTCTVSLDGQSLTQATGNGGTSLYQHTYLFYLKEAGIAAATNTTLTVAVSGGTASYSTVYAGVYSGVDQTAAITTGSYGSASTSSTVGPLSPSLTISSGGQAVEVVNLARTGSTSPRTISTWATNWSNTLSSTSSTANPSAAIYLAADTTAGTTTSSHTASSSTLASMSAMVLNAITGSPTVTSVSPTSLISGSGLQTLTINGSGLTGATAVTILNGTTVDATITVGSPTVVSDSQLTVPVTVGAAAVGARNIKVTTGVSTGPVFAATGFIAAGAPAPTVTSISPTVLGQGGAAQNVVITGANFVSGTGLSANFGTGVTVNSTTYNSATQLTANITVTTSATAGAHNVIVTNPDTQTGTGTGLLTVDARPTVTSASPLSANQGTANQNVVITGTGFVNGAGLAAVFSGTGITVNSTTYNSATQLTANITISSSATAGSRTITVTNGDTGVSAAGGSFTVVDPLAPTVTSVFPTTVGQGAFNVLLTINGTNFASGATVTFSSSRFIVASTSTQTGPATYLSPTQLSILVNTSTSSVASSNVTVTNTDSRTGALASAVSTVANSISPTYGSLGNSYTITLTSTGLTATGGYLAASVSGGGITVGTISVTSATTATIPITIDPSYLNAPLGARTLTFVNGDGGVRVATFTVRGGAPTVTAVSPSLAQGATAQNVTISGTNFYPGAAAAFSNTGISVNSTTYVNSTTLTANVTVSSSATIGASNVTVTNSDTQTATGTGAVTITGGPAITSVSPATGAPGSTLSVTINGSNFVTGAAVKFSGTDITVNSVSGSGTSLTANITIARNAVLSSRTVKVTNPDGSNVSGGSFTVQVPTTTTVGVLTFSKVTNSSITVSANFSGDYNANNSCTILWGTTPGSYPNTATAVLGANAWTATLTGLTGGADGTGQAYYFQATFGDPDGVTGATVAIGSQSTLGSALNHNSDNISSSKWSQGWGIPNGKYGAFSCSTCHARGGTNDKLVAGSFTTPSLENWSSVQTSNTASVTYTNGVLGSDTAHQTSVYACEVCHNRTAHNKYNNPGQNHFGTENCLDCHNHGESFMPNCIGCHSTAQGANGYRRQVVGNGGDFFTNMTTHGFSTVKSKSCSACHDTSSHQSFSDGVSVLLRKLDGSSSVVYDGTSATAGAVKGACISCHNANGATILGANALSPFSASGDMRSPANIDQYWPATGGAHDTKMVCFNCHGSSNAGDTVASYNGHASGASHLLQDAGYNVVTPNNYCVNCHSASSTNMNKSSKNIGSQLASSYKHVTAQCFDCHGDESNAVGSMHVLKSGSQTAGSGIIANNIAFATGRNLTWSATNWGGASASSTLTAGNATAEYQVCLKCHGAVGTGTTPDVTNASYTGAGSLTNLALEYNPNNMSRHPVGTPLGAASQLTAAKLAGGWTPGSVMTCSDCHATDTAASKGPHGSSVKWMLTGTNKAWPYTTAAANGTTSGTYFAIGSATTNSGTTNGLFCLNCHTIVGSNAFHTLANSNGEHSGTSTLMACASCHIRVPHGGKVSRLLLTTSAPARYTSNGNGGFASSGNSFAGWGTASGNIRNTTVTSGYFKSSCSKHSSGTGTEAW